MCRVLTLQLGTGEHQRASTHQRGINASTVHHARIPLDLYYLLCLRDTKLYQFLLLTVSDCVLNYNF